MRLYDMTSKVRIACRRCRAKRIKCDGSLLACANCQKAGEPCVDVDGRNNALSIPRDFATNACSRIEWLEKHIRRMQPGFDLSAGPRVDFSFIDNGIGPGPAPSPASTQLQSQQGHSSTQILLPEEPQATAASKRTYASIADTGTMELPFAEDARSVALDLGMLTLSSDSRQMHYLGTSSGRLFTSLIGVSGESEPSISTRSNRSSSIPSLPSPAGKPGPFAHAKRLKESYRVVYETLRKGLPSLHDAQVLLDVYFLNIHVDHPFIHPASLINALDALYDCAATDSTFEIGHNGWINSVPPFPYNGEFGQSRNIHTTPISIFTATFHVFMVFTLAATVRTRQRKYDFAPDQFQRIATSVASNCLSHASLASIQGILLLAVHSLISPTELNIWTLTYVAMAHSIDLGLHRTAGPKGESTATATLMRQMVFYNVYHLDRSIAVIQGRPLSIRDEAFDVELPTAQEVQIDAATIKDSPFTPEVPIAGLVAFALHRFKLDPIISEIKLFLYQLPERVSVYAWPSDHDTAQRTIRNRLEDWRNELLHLAGSLPNADGYDQLEWRKYETKLHSQYFAAMILLHQPSQMIPHPSDQALLTCYQSAAGRLNAYNDLYHMDSFYQSWRSVQGIFSSGATMIYCLWTSSLVRDKIAPADAMSDFRTCSNLLSVGGEWWPSVKKGKVTFSKATDALLKKLDFIQGHINSQMRNARSRVHRDGFGPQSPIDEYLDIPTHTSGILSGTQQTDFIPATSTVLETEEQNQARSSPLAVGSILSCVGQSSKEESRVTHDFNNGFDPDDANAPVDFPLPDWNATDPSNNQTFHNAHSGTETVYDISMNDPTVEAFIAEYLNNDTAWNPF